MTSFFAYLHVVCFPSCEGAPQAQALPVSNSLGSLWNSGDTLLVILLFCSCVWEGLSVH